MTEPGNERIDNGLVLPGLDGTNPLGFLAALGTLRIVTFAEEHGPVYMLWVPRAGTWVPCLRGSLGSEPELLDVLEQYLCRSLDAHALGRILAVNDVEPGARRQEMRTHVGSVACGNRIDADWLAAFTSDAVPPEANNQLQTVRRDYFPRNLRTIMERAERRHLERSLFHAWDYADALDNQSLHLDPSEDRRHAHQWAQPSGDPDRKRSGGMLGANRLAIEALPVFVSVPEGDRLHTLAFSGFQRNDTRWTWPLWGIPMDLATTRSLLALPQPQEERPSRSAIEEVSARGVVGIFRTHRILVGKTPNFTPAQRIA